MSEPHIRSHLGVYALVTQERRRVLVIKKMRGPYTGMYDLPGGSLESLELLEDALKREILEETSCTALTYRQLTTLSTLFSFEKDKQPAVLRHIGVIYECTIAGEPRTDSDGQDAGGCLWMPIENVNNTEFTPFVMGSLKAAGYLER